MPCYGLFQLGFLFLQTYSQDRNGRNQCDIDTVVCAEPSKGQGLETSCRVSPRGTAQQTEAPQIRKMFSSYENYSYGGKMSNMLRYGPK